MLDLFDTRRDKQEGDMYENIIPSPLILWSVANKYREATFMRISGVLCKHPGKISGDKGDHSRLGRMVK